MTPLDPIMATNLYQAMELDKHTNREQPWASIRHAVRWWYRREGYTHRMVQDLEYKATGHRPDRSSVIHSVKVASVDYIGLVATEATHLRIRP
jgi:hypothetical protein